MTLSYSVLTQDTAAYAFAYDPAADVHESLP
jgi:hypothetical protein